jgi:predicted transcriptional regulator
MSTTTIRLDDEMKDRIAAAAERTGKTTHAFILDAIAQTVEQAELDTEFHRIADERWANLLATGKTVPWTEAAAYLQSRSKGVKARKPPAKRPGR